MSNEQSKAAARRCHSHAFVSRYFVGDGLDAGCGDDPLPADDSRFPLIKSVVRWDKKQGDGQFMLGMPDDHFDFVHASHCLEEMKEPWIALGHWIRITKPGGHVIVTVPDEDMYEQGHWPSLFNGEHKWSFTVKKQGPSSSASINILDLIAPFTDRVSIEKIEVVRDYYPTDLEGNDEDQSKDPLIECAIEFVLRKSSQPEGRKP